MKKITLLQFEKNASDQKLELEEMNVIKGGRGRVRSRPGKRKRKKYRKR